ncbi:MAG: choice-of-anchor Q domain-containing protein [Chloroflexaceae bacterium]
MDQPLHPQDRSRRTSIRLIFAIMLLVTAMALPGSPFPPGNTARAAPGDTYTVTTTDDTLAYPACTGSSPSISCTTLRAAIAAANKSGGGTIDLTGLSGTITLVDDMETIGPSMSIRGPGPDVLTIDGDNSHRQFTVGVSDFPAAEVTISGLELINGESFSGGAIYVDFAVLMLDDMVITNGFSDSDGGGIYVASDGILQISRSTLDRNSAGEGNGGGIYTAGRTSVTETTISNNSAFEGGGIYARAGSYTDEDQVEAPGTLNMTNSTVSGNDATDGAGGGIYLGQNEAPAPQSEIRHSTITGNNVEDESSSGGIYANGQLLIDHTIIAGNTVFATLGFPEISECEVAGNFILTNSYNLFGVDGDAGGCPAGATDIIPTAGVQIGDILSLLVDNGGPTHTHALVANGPAQDTGNSGITGAPATDQRGSGFDRIVNTVDIGAYEIQELIVLATMSKTADPVSLPEPGGIVTFTVVISNSVESGQEFSVTTLQDDIYGDIADATNPNLNSTTCSLPSSLIAVGNNYTCRFQAAVTGEPGTYTDIVTATLTAADETTSQIQAGADVELTDLPPTINVTKTVTPESLPAPGGTVTFSVTVQNTSAEPVTITALNDINPGVQVQQINCGVGTVLPISGTCSYTSSVTINGNAGDSFTGTVDVTAQDNEQNNAGDADSATVTLTESLTAITLARFTAQRGTGGVHLLWETTMELDTWGFHLWRSSDGTRANAIRLTDRLILAEGHRTGGATYRWTDTSAVAGTGYSYWLEEVELSGISNSYGPAAWQTTPQQAGRIFLPLVVR